MKVYLKSNNEAEYNAINSQEHIECANCENLNGKFVPLNDDGRMRVFVCPECGNDDYMKFKETI